MPARIPNLLINGSSGIAVGMATNIPPHNLNEVLDACLAQLKNPDITIDELIEVFSQWGAGIAGASKTQEKK